MPTNTSIMSNSSGPVGYFCDYFSTFEAITESPWFANLSLGNMTCSGGEPCNEGIISEGLSKGLYLVHNGTTVELMKDIQSDPDVAGVGIFIAFAVGFYFSWIAAQIIHGFELFEISERRKRIGRMHGIIDTILISWSDQQIVLGLATSIATLYHWGSFSTYHFNIIKQWLVFCTITHANALLVHCEYFGDKRKWLNRLRGALMSIHTVLTIYVFFKDGNFNIIPGLANKTPLQILPARCFFTNASRGETLETIRQSTTEYGSLILLLTAFILLLFGLGSLIVRLFSKRTARQVSWVLRQLGLSGNLIVGAYVTSKICYLRIWLTDEQLIDDEEHTYSYGQFVPILMSIFVLFGAIETWLDEGTSKSLSERKISKHQHESD